MKCPVCHNDSIQFLGIWYTERENVYVLLSHYGCQKCRVVHTRPVSENDFYYLKEDGGLIMRPPHIQIKNERRINIIEIDPGFYVRR
jgi:hypothetical protein